VSATTVVTLRNCSSKLCGMIPPREALRAADRALRA
jgi:hypothetical protein